MGKLSGKPMTSLYLKSSLVQVIDTHMVQPSTSSSSAATTTTTATSSKTSCIGKKTISIVSINPMDQTISTFENVFEVEAVMDVTIDIENAATMAAGFQVKEKKRGREKLIIKFSRRRTYIKSN